MYKQVVVVRTDIGMSRGKISSQVAHASLSAWKDAEKSAIEEWEKGGSKKAVLKAGSEEELEELKREAERRDLPSALIRDAGLTEIPEGTVTCLAVGPAPEEEIDRVTGDLPLLD